VPAASPWLDQFAPAQWAPFVGPFGASTVYDPATGPGPGPAPTPPGHVMSPHANNTEIDTTLHWKLGGTIILALILIFALERMGFRFVSSANVSAGFGR
jgi:hypothetical protein